MSDELKRTGEARQFETGAQRDSGEGKLKMSLMPLEPLKRVQKRYLDGANEYGANNWTKGMPISELYDSANRHMQDFWEGKTDEDHLAAAAWNIFGLMWTISNKPELDDRKKGFPNAIT
jgi:hypothetical protein